MRVRDGHLVVLAVLLVGEWATLACSPSSGSPASSRGNATLGAGGAIGASGGPAQNFGGAPVGPVNGAAGDPTFDPTTIQTHSNTDASCAGDVKQAERETITTKVPMEVAQPVALYIMLDQSGSMSEPATTGTKWSTVVDGFTAFVKDPKSAGIDVALNFFPPLFGDPGDCTGAGYDTPHVPMGPLPANAAPIIAAFGAAPTGFNTPTEGGLRGAETYCENYQKAHADEKCVVVFATDGQPSTCDKTLTDLTQIVTDAKTAGVTTFAIGMAGQNANEVDFDFLNTVAKAGGTDCNPTNPGHEACNIGGGSDLSTALNTIRSTVTQYVTKTEVRTSTLACNFTIPDAPMGQRFDRDKVNVNFKNTSNQNESVFRAASLADCANTASKAWYYDDPTTPTKILLCPKTCADINAGAGDGGVISAASAGSAPGISVVFGCATIVAPPA